MQINQNDDFDIKPLYRKRVIDARVETLLKVSGGVLILGPMWCGKSWTGEYHSESKIFIGDEGSAELAELDPQLALTGEYPRLVDEWQDVPKLWDVARRTIDRSGAKGMYIFTGSSVPRKKKTHHSGTGRFSRIYMRPLSLFESGDSTGEISLSELFNTGRIVNMKSPLDYRKAVRLICKGGWPAAFSIDEKDAEEIPALYVNSVINYDFSKVDGKKRKKETLELVLRSLARNTSSPVKMSTIAEDVSRNGTTYANATISDYVGVLKSMFLITAQEPWTPMLRSSSRVRKTPKLHFTDPSLAATLLGARQDVLAKDPETAGFMFESLCYRDLCVYSSALKGEVFHYRDNTGLEVDEIIVLDDGKWAAAEVKLGTSKIDDAASNLLKLKNKVTDEVGAPSFLMVLCATSGLAYTRPDGVMVVPIDLLGP